MKTLAICIVLACAGCQRLVNSPPIELRQCWFCFVLVYNGTTDAQQGSTIPTDLGRGASAAVGPAAVSGPGGAGVITLPPGTVNPLGIPPGASTLEFYSPEMSVTPN